jgi:hypothetical protein
MTDNTINTEPRTILLKGDPERMERVAGGTITPGALVKLNSSNQLVVHSTAGGNTNTIFALENELFGKGIDDNYSANDYVQAGEFDGDDHVLAYVAASAAAIVIGDQVESAGDGSVRIRSSGTTIGTALEAVDNSGNGASIARLRIAVR